MTTSREKAPEEALRRCLGFTNHLIPCAGGRCVCKLYEAESAAARALDLPASPATGACGKRSQWGHLCVKPAGHTETWCATGGDIIRWDTAHATGVAQEHEAHTHPLEGPGMHVRNVPCPRCEEIKHLIDSASTERALATASGFADVVVGQCRHVTVEHGHDWACAPCIAALAQRVLRLRAAAAPEELLPIGGIAPKWILDCKGHVDHWNADPGKWPVCVTCACKAIEKAITAQPSSGRVAQEVTVTPIPPRRDPVAIGGSICLACMVGDHCGHIERLGDICVGCACGTQPNRAAPTKEGTPDV